MNKINNICPKVSIIIPVYNGSNFLKESIDSALAQTYENTEIIVVNDGSNDKGATEKIAVSYGDKIRYFTKENGGVASALNLAVEKMTGEYFSWLSHDDLYEKDKVKRQIELLQNLGEGKFIIYSDYACFSGDSGVVVTQQMDGVSPKHFRYWLTLKSILNGCTLLIPRNAFEEFGNFDESLLTTQDYDLWFRFSAEYRFVHIAEILVKSRQHSRQGSVQLAGLAKHECDRLFIKFIESLTIEEIKAASKKEIWKAFKDIEYSMNLRGLKGASLLASNLAVKFGAPKDSIMDKKKLKFALMKRLIRDILRVVLPDFLFFALKKFLYKIGIWNVNVGDYSESVHLEKHCAAVARHNDLPYSDIIKLIDDLQIKILLELPCGYSSWLKNIQIELEQYIGCDIVEQIVRKNRQEFASNKVRFEVINFSIDNLPKADLIFSRDLLNHLSLEEAFKVIANFKKSGAKYLLAMTNNDIGQNNELMKNENFERELNLNLPPFNFPKSVKLINTGGTQGSYKNKYLGLWLLKDIKLPPEWY